MKLVWNYALVGALTLAAGVIVAGGEVATAELRVVHAARDMLASMFSPDDAPQKKSASQATGCK